jgi:hypothetical protein
VPWPFVLTTPGQKLVAYEVEFEMLFVDEGLSKLDPENQTGLASLLQHLCGENVAIGCRIDPLSPCENCQFCVNWSALVPRLRLPSLALA